MNIVVLNWSLGENDPFTPFTNLLARRLEQYGHEVVVVGVDREMAKRLVDAKAGGAELALTWQGLGSDLRAGGTDRSIWDLLELPLVCLHGDHPCHMPANHRHDSHFVAHLYGAESFAGFARRHIPGAAQAESFSMPNIFVGGCGAPTEYSGDYFVFPKNYDDTQEFLASLERQYSEGVCDVLYEICDRVQSEACGRNVVDHHKIIEEHLSENYIRLLGGEIGSKDELATRLHIHSRLDKFYRNLMSEAVLLQLADVRLRVYGRGWDRFKAMRNPNHEFFDFTNVAEGGWQYCSNYGVIDVAPINDALHDRTLRAVGFGNGFLMGSSWWTNHLPGLDFGGLFYTLRAGELRERAEAVMGDPRAHRSLAGQFGAAYDRAFHFPGFLERAELLSQRMAAGGRC